MLVVSRMMPVSAICRRLASFSKQHCRSRMYIDRTSSIWSGVSNKFFGCFKYPANKSRTTEQGKHGKALNTDSTNKLEAFGRIRCFGFAHHYSVVHSIIDLKSSDLVDSTARGNK